jgi:hypothetical protein
MLHHLVVLLVAMAMIAGCGNQGPTEAERTEAELYCTLQPGIPSIHSEEFQNCVEAQLGSAE